MVYTDREIDCPVNRAIFFAIRQRVDSRQQAHPLFDEPVISRMSVVLVPLSASDTDSSRSGLAGIHC